MAENHALIAESAAMYPRQTDALKEVNLVSGDFERQYRGGVMEKGVGRRRRCAALGVVVAALAVWLLVLTVLREVQISRLRQELDELSANMIAMTANVKSLNQKIANNRLFNEFMTLEDTIYADDENDNSLRPMTKKDEESLEKLHGLTELEDDNIGDDEDMYDGDDDDAESGDWYPDYDKREKIGKTSMVRLKPEDFTDSVILDNGKEINSNIRKIKRLLNENPENPNLFFPPTKVESTTKNSDNNRVKRSVFPENVDEFAAPRIVSKLETRRKSKKYSPSEELTTNKASVHAHTVSRTARNSIDEGSQRRPFIAAHFHGNTSHLSTEIHEHYKGNGLVRVSHGAQHDVWYPSAWTIASPHPRPTLTRNGHIHVHHTGVYLVYVQIYYLDNHDIISWVLHRTNADIDGRETLLQCAQSAHSLEPYDKPNSCFSASALFLKAGDRLAVRNTGGDRHSLMQPEKSFIGLVKLADAEDPEEEF